MQSYYFFMKIDNFVSTKLKYHLLWVGYYLQIELPMS